MTLTPSDLAILAAIAIGADWEGDDLLELTEEQALRLSWWVEGRDGEEARA